MKSLFIACALLMAATCSFAQTAGSSKTDEMAIRKVLEAESMAAKNADYNSWIKCFARTADVAFGYHPELPDYMIRGYEELAAFGKKFFPPEPKPNKETFTFENFRVRIQGNTAFASYLQVSTQEDGKQQRFQKGEYLEKINGEWKMIGHFFFNVPDKAEEAKK
jgi:ketosteroid isomerase-like protein